jgi:23S rRNA maturation-related 3'-5' exoribonuclease YhaM
MVGMKVLPDLTNGKATRSIKKACERLNIEDAVAGAILLCVFDQHGGQVYVAECEQLNAREQAFLHNAIREDGPRNSIGVLA